MIEVIAFQNQTVIYDILFRAASETLRTIAADPEHLGAEIGFLGVLHTWGQNLLHHPHIYFLVPGGGIAPDDKRWIACRRGFFLPVRVLSRMFRGRFMHYLEQAFRAGELDFFSAHRHLHEPAAFLRHLAPVWDTEWVVYTKRPFAGPAQVLEYVGRYTHRVAISNNRLVSMDNGRVRFRWKDYRDGNRQKIMPLDANEFIRRFLIHVLPDGFHRIRYFGFLGNCHRARKLKRCRELLGMASPIPADPPADYRDRYQALTPSENALHSPTLSARPELALRRATTLAVEAGQTRHCRAMHIASARFRSLRSLVQNPLRGLPSDNRRGQGPRPGSGRPGGGSRAIPSPCTASILMLQRDA